jgi:anti-sigma factor RsiW
VKPENEFDERLREALHELYDPVLAEPVPPALAGSRYGRRRRAVAVVLVAASVALGLAAGWMLHIQSGEMEGRMVRRAATAHEVYAAEVRHPVEVGAAQEAELATWLSERLGMQVVAPDLRTAGLALVGGRLLPGEARPAALLLYETRDGRRASVYWAPDTTRKGKGGLGYAREKSVSVFYWVDEECGYGVASADIAKDHLSRIARMVYHQLEH